MINGNRKEYKKIQTGKKKTLSNANKIACKLPKYISVFQTQAAFFLKVEPQVKLGTNKQTKKGEGIS